MAVAIAVATDLADLGRITLARLRGPVVALSGGATFEALFSHWSGSALRGISFLPVDERRVGLSEPGSNWMLATRLLFDPNHLAEQALHWTPSAAHLEALVRRLVACEPGTMASLPQVWLGMGDDGHTASLFPNGPELVDTTSLALETTAPKPPHPRVTLGLGVLKAAQDLCVVVTGAAKGPVLRRVLDGDLDLPLARVLEHRGVSLFLDSACARTAGI